MDRGLRPGVSTAESAELATTQKRITKLECELVAFDNRRVLHGRRAFHSTERRHFQGCYIDAIHSTVRLASTLGDPVAG